MYMYVFFYTNVNLKNIHTHAVYFFPGTNYLQEISHDMIEFASQQTMTQTISGSAEFDMYADNVWMSLQLPVAQNWQQALDNYFTLRSIALDGI